MAIYIFLANLFSREEDAQHSPKTPINQSQLKNQSELKRALGEGLLREKSLKEGNTRILKKPYTRLLMNLSSE